MTREGPLLRIAADILAKLSPLTAALKSGLHSARISALGKWWFRKIVCGTLKREDEGQVGPLSGIIGGSRRLNNTVDD